MPGLYPIHPIADGETPQSFVSAIAPLHGATTAREFCRDMGLRFQLIVDGDEEEVGALARLAGVDASTLIAGSIRRRGGVNFTLREQSLTGSTLRRYKPHVCPACLVSDLGSGLRPGSSAMYGRAWWLLEPLRTCPLHDCALVEVASAPPSHRAHDFRLLVASGLDEIRRLAGEPVVRRASDFETYMLGRLQGSRRVSPWLDALPWHVVARTCEMIGAVAEFGRKAKPRMLSDAEWHCAGAAGFAVADGGEASLRTYLSDLQRDYSRASSGNEGAQAMYGCFYVWLAGKNQHPDFQPIRDLVFDHVHETLPVGPDDELFGRAFPDRRVHSIRTATLATGTQPKRLRKVLAANGLLPSDHAGRLDHHVIFDARAASAVLVDASDTISLISAARRLNVGRKIADALVNSGLIRRFVMADTNAGGLGTHGVSRTDVDALLELLARDAVPVDRAGKGVFKITHAAKAATRNSIDIISLIVDRKLDWVGRLVGSHGIAAILVNADEVRALLKEPELPGLTQREIMKYLRTTSGVAKTLMNQGIITTMRAVNPLTHAMINVVSEQELRCFRFEYVSLYELAQDRKDSPVGLKSRLIAAGVRPAFDPEIIKASFYRRKDVS